MLSRLIIWLARTACAVGFVVVSPVHAQTYFDASIGGEIVPGVYGRINIGDAGPPPVLYAQPIIIERRPRARYEPVYLYVPPGHAKNWSKHCARYDACYRPVYFVKEPVRSRGRHDNQGWRDDRHDRYDRNDGHGRGDRHGRDDRRGNGRDDRHSRNDRDDHRSDWRERQERQDRQERLLRSSRPGDRDGN